ncbi:MAG: glycoside hydrolase family 15 protein [Caldisericaceae bacterium]
MELRDNFTTWEKGLKDGIGTALTSKSLVYFTIGNGILTETYYPSPDTIALHSLRFFINDAIDESTLPYDVSIENLNAPLYKVRTLFGSIAIEKEFFADNDSSNLRIHYDFGEPLSGTFKIFPIIDNAKVESRESEFFIFGKDKVIAFSFDKKFESIEYEEYIFVHFKKLKELSIKILFGDIKNFKKTNNKDLQDIHSIKKDFVRGWESYLNKFDFNSKSTLYLRSAIMIKSMEDKIHKGATVASLALPWGSKFPLSENNGYHLVWVRDLFFTSLAMASMGDFAFANSSLEYMFAYLRRADGSFKQNSTIDGRERWNATQMDQAAFPIILAYKLGRKDLIEELRVTADFIVEQGPKTEQERWEEIGGYSAYSMSLEARALELYALMSNDRKGAHKYQTKALEFKRLIARKTLAVAGKFGKYYFVRISNGDADATSKELFLKNSYFAPSEMVSNDFIYTVFTGIYPHFDFRISESLKASDSLLRIDTPRGPSFYRYNGDVYGFDNPLSPKGRLWVLLTAERGMLELYRGKLDESKKFLNALEQFATKQYILPEQVFENGEPTESSAPLAWSHASYMILHDRILRKDIPSLHNPYL